MKLSLLRMALVASLLVFGVGVVPATTAGAVIIPAPGVPQNVAATAGGHQITVTWSAPVSGAAPTKYIVQAGKAVLTAQCKYVVAPTTTCVMNVDPTVPRRATGQLYKVAVRAFNGTKAGPISPKVSVLFGKPTIPAGVTAAAGNNAAVVSWNASTPSNWQVTGYTVTASGGGGQCTTATTSCTVPALTNGVPYTFTVTATNAVGTTLPSSPSNQIVAGTPAAPTGVSAALAFCVGCVSISYTAPDPGGGPILLYQVTAYDQTNPLDPSNGNYSAGGNPAIIGGLKPGDSYTFSLTAYNLYGAGAMSAQTDPPIAWPSPPGAPTGVTASATSLYVNAVVVSFTAPNDGGSPIALYHVIATDIDNPGDSHNGAYSAGATTLLLTGFTAGDHYTFTVYATNGIGDGPSSAPSSPFLIS